MSRKSIILVFSFLFFYSFANAAETVTAYGRLFYPNTDRVIVDRDAELILPIRGQGNVVLLSGETTLISDSFSTSVENGKKVFSIVFVDAQDASDDSVVLFKGTYMRGLNLAKYYGDYYHATRDSSSFLNSPKSNIDWEHVGGFYFNTPIIPDFE